MRPLNLHSHDKTSPRFLAIIIAVTLVTINSHLAIAALGPGGLLDRLEGTANGALERFEPLVQSSTEDLSTVRPVRLAQTSTDVEPTLKELMQEEPLRVFIKRRSNFFVAYKEFRESLEEAKRHVDDPRIQIRTASLLDRLYRLYEDEKGVFLNFVAAFRSAESPQELRTGESALNTHMKAFEDFKARLNDAEQAWTNHWTANRYLWNGEVPEHRQIRMELARDADMLVKPTK